jgi:2-C-methyl-D-erythritol 4-phosphate cytidylyltransferase
MKKANVHNVILIMSGGVGSRFGADCPKQYCMMGGKKIIEYAIDAARFCPSVDEVVIVTAKEYLEEVREQYGFPTTLGGANRTESLANGLAYIAANYDCEKVIVANAVCPLMTEEQLDRYFKLLDEYDYVLTSWKVVSTLHRYDGVRVDRNDYFHVMEPEAYRFKLLYENYKKDYPVPYIFHQLPQTAKGYFCFDYPYTMKITYSTDVKMAMLLYDSLIRKPKQDMIKQNVTMWLSSFGSEGIAQWVAQVPSLMSELADKWRLKNWIMNPKTFATCVFEAESEKYGSVIVKFHAPSGRYKQELAYYKACKNGRMATLLDYDDGYRALLIKKIVPGMQVGFDSTNEDLHTFFSEVAKSFIPIEDLPSDVDFVDIRSDFENNVQKSSRFNFAADKKQRLEEVARQIWDSYFAQSPKYYLHRDFQRRNILRGVDGVYAIDPLGIIGPKEFEYTIGFVIEEKARPDEFIEIHREMLEFFSKYCDRKRLLAALFITWVHKMDEYVFAKNDDQKLAKWSLGVIEKIFYAGDGGILEKDEESAVPEILR